MISVLISVVAVKAEKCRKSVLFGQMYRMRSGDESEKNENVLNVWNQFGVRRGDDHGTG